MSSSSRNHNAQKTKPPFLTREQFLLRRARHIKSLFKLYKEHYWALAEEIRAKHRDYYWNYALSPMESENKREVENVENGGDEEEEVAKERSKCGSSACQKNAMPFTRFCSQHILSDAQQTLYKGCAFKSGQNVSCQKPILRATVPSLCSAHSQKVQKHLTQSLKKVNINLSSSSRPTAQFNAILAEYVHNVQEERKKALTNRLTTLNSTTDNIIDERMIIDSNDTLAFASSI